MDFNTKSLTIGLMLWLVTFCSVSHFLPGTAASEKGISTEESDKLREKHARTLGSLEEQYDASRYVTHIAKGAGLGYGSGTMLAEHSKFDTELP